MKTIDSPLHGLHVLQPEVHADRRGSFYEGFHSASFKARGISMSIAQVNHSISRKNVLRGLHFQRPPAEQAKLVHVTAGSVMDVVVDMRQHSPTYGKHYRRVMDGNVPTLLYIPGGFAHGFLVLSRLARVQYACDTHRSPEHEGGIRYDDPMLNIQWGVPKEHVVLSERDKQWGDFSACATTFP